MLRRLLLWLAGKNQIFAHAKRAYQHARDAYYARQKVRKKLIVFESFRSSKYADSPKAIYEYMLSSTRYNDYSFIWVFEEPDDYRFLKNSRTKLVKHESHAHYMAFARAKYWIVNGWLPLRFTKKAEQIMLQCWHGTPLKRLRYDILDSADTQHKIAAFRDNDSDAERFDYFVSPSKFTTEVFTSAFNLKSLGKEDIIIETGYPRNDFLINHTQADVDRAKKQLDIPKNKKVLLYAPTWRDDQTKEGGGYEYSMTVDFDYLKRHLSDDYIVLFRAHNLVSNEFDFNAYKGFVYDVSRVDDINDLYIISDALMTDYSSVFFDYANLRRPIIFFMYDLEYYSKALRGFYLELSQLPGDIVKKESEVVDILRNIDQYEIKHAENYQLFHDTFNYLDDGQATKRVVESIIKE